MKNINPKKYPSQKGIATLPTILVLAILILAVGTSVALLGLNSSLISQDQLNGQTALFYAESGAQDALLKIARNSGYSCTTANCYTIDMATSGCSSSTACAKITVSSGTGASGNPKIITSTGYSGSNNRKVIVQVSIDSTGAITSYTWTDSPT